jgi:cyclopropane-fatty-acyl-phospholipid synthase
MSTTAPSAAPPRTDENIRRASAFLTRLLPHRRGFDIRLWDGSLIPGIGEPKVTVVINAPGSLRRMLRPPVELSLGEAYLRGDFDFEGDIWEAGPALEASRGAARSPGELLALARRWRRLPRGAGGHRMESGYGESPARIEAAELSREWDREGIRYHYDAGNDFFSLFLDRRMIYSCAYFPTGTEELDAAQEAKLEHICRKLRLRRDERLLDIGCGWGGLVIYAAQRYGIRALGVTLSEQQHRLATRRIHEAGLDDRVEVRFLDYRDVDEEPFDKLVSVGMFEHVGRERLPEYFARTYQALRPGGLFLNHGIAGRPRQDQGIEAAVRKRLEPLLVGGSTFRRRYIFPSGGLVAVSEANLLAERAGFEVRDVENLREHYALTLRHWARRLEARENEAVRLGGRGMYRLWRLYMGMGSWQFQDGEFGLFQTLLEKPAGGPSSLPPTRADLYTPAGLG